MLGDFDQVAIWDEPEAKQVKDRSEYLGGVCLKAIMKQLWEVTKIYMRIDEHKLFSHENVGHFGRNWFKMQAVCHFEYTEYSMHEEKR